jgi:hypothetical protein
MTGPPTPRLPFEYQQSITKMRADTTLTYKTAPNSLILVAFSVVEKLGYRFVSVEGGTYLYRRDTQILQI